MFTDTYLYSNVPMILKENGQAANPQQWWPLGTGSTGWKLGKEGLGLHVE